LISLSPVPLTGGPRLWPGGHRRRMIVWPERVERVERVERAKRTRRSKRLWGCGVSGITVTAM